MSRSVLAHQVWVSDKFCLNAAFNRIQRLREKFKDYCIWFLGTTKVLEGVLND